MVKFLEKFRRVTSSGGFIAEVDGLRFLAIILVVLYHIRGVFLDYSEKNIEHYNGSFKESFLYPIFYNGNQGVEIFFAISGFILALPFIQQFRYGGRPISLGNFYIRRLTRLEPPYLLALSLLFLVAVFVNKADFFELFPHYLASFFYIHNLIYDELPKVSSVTWSLEIEVQFYLLTPLIMRIYKWPKNLTRGVWIGVLLGLPLLQNIWAGELNWLFKFFQYFAVGILLADVYADKESFLYKIESKLYILAGLGLLAGILYTNSNISANKSSYAEPGLPLFYKMIFPVLVFFFFSIVLGNPFWKRVFQFPFVSITGGMCYSIYLLHTGFISALGNKIFKWPVSSDPMIDFLIKSIPIMICIWIVSGIYFLAIEKPCMQKDWHKKLFRRKETVSI